jgi:hypothetical protein
LRLCCSSSAERRNPACTRSPILTSRSFPR